MTADFSRAEQNFEGKEQPIDPSFGNHSISEADAWVEMTAEFSRAEQDFEEKERPIDPSFENHSISEADVSVAEIVAPISSEFSNQL